MMSIEKREALLKEVRVMTQIMRDNQNKIKSAGDARRYLLQELREHGASVRYIAKEIGVSPQTVYNELEKVGQ